MAASRGVLHFSVTSSQEIEDSDAFTSTFRMGAQTHHFVLSMVHVLEAGNVSCVSVVYSSLSNNLRCVSCDSVNSVRVRVYVCACACAYVIWFLLVHPCCFFSFSYNSLATSLCLCCQCHTCVCACVR